MRRSLAARLALSFALAPRTRFRFSRWFTAKRAKSVRSLWTAKMLVPIVARNVDRETYLMTDEAEQYQKQFRPIFLGHGVVTHTAREYGRGRIRTNTVEG